MSDEMERAREAVIKAASAARSGQAFPAVRYGSEFIAALDAYGRACADRMKAAAANTVQARHGWGAARDIADLRTDIVLARQEPPR